MAKLQMWISSSIYTAKFHTANGQQADNKWLTDDLTANGYKSAHATVCALEHWSTVCCPNICQPFVHKYSSAWIVHRKICWPINQSTVCAQMDIKRLTEIFVNSLTSVIFCCVIDVVSYWLVFQTSRSRTGHCRNSRRGSWILRKR